MCPPPSNYFMSNTQTPSIINSQISQTFPSIPPNNPTMFSNDEVGSQFSQLSIQIGLKDIAIEEIEGSSTKRKPQLAFAIEEDMHLISSWLNISIDPIIGVGQAKEAFWLRVTKNYNKF